MNLSNKFIYAVSFALAGAGFILPLWPLVVLGILVAALSGRWIFAFVIGILVDVAWGVPQGILHYLYFPFTELALLAALIYYFSRNYFLDRSSPDTL